MFTRRKLISALPLATLSCARGPRPNILFAIADDMSFPHAGAYGDKIARTPAFDRIAREGVLFTNSFCASPSCTPSRSAVLTGRHVWQLEEAGLLYGTIPPKFPLFTHMLEDSGYHVGFTGKGWGPGDWKAAGLKRNPTGKPYNRRTHAVTPREGINPNDYAANFEDFLKDRPANSPFFFWFGSTEPHRVYAKGAGVGAGHRLEEVRVPAYWPDTPEIRADILDYYAEVEWFDTQLARVREALEKTGEIDNTLIIVTSDNGMPFPRAKVNLYDAGVHMPLAMRWPKRIRPNSKVRDFVEHTDLAPTMLEAAGLQPRSGMAGHSLLGLEGRDQAFTAFERHVMARPDGLGYPMRALRTKEFLYIRNFAPDRWPTGGPFLSSNKTQHGDVDGAPIKDFMTDPVNQQTYAGPYQLCFGKRPPEELYDLARDPEQVEDLATDTRFQSHLQRLRNQLEAYLRETQDPRMEGKDPWKDYPYRQATGYGASFNTGFSKEVRRKAREGATHKPE